MKTAVLYRRSHVVAVNINLEFGIWIARLPRKLPRGYCDGRKTRIYKPTARNVARIDKAAQRAGFWWSDDRNGRHFHRDGF